MKELSKYEKLKKFQDYRFNRVERHTAAVYLNAIRKNDTEMIDYFESFGDTMNKIILNVRTYERNLEFGFESKEFNKYGWIDNGRLTQGESVEIDKLNYISLGVSPNGLWFYGINTRTPYGSGRGSGACIWGKPYNKEIDAVISGLEELIEWYEIQLKSIDLKDDQEGEDEEGYKTPKPTARIAFCNKIIKSAKMKISETKEPQLSLF